MGGRGSSYGVEILDATGMGKEKEKAEALIVAGMTPTEKGSRYTNAEKSLAYIEAKKRNYTKEQLQVLDEHGYVTRAFQGNEHSVSVDSDTFSYMKGKIVTHNHPSLYGGTFSKADISTLKAGMKEIRASAREGTYSMKATAEADASGLFKAYQRDEVKIQNQMKEIALEVATKRKWSSKQKFEYANRKEQLKVLHEWYGENASKYGFDYSFIPVEKMQDEI